MRSGTSTLGAQYTVSVIKNARKIKAFLGDSWDLVEIVKRDSLRWLERQCDRKFDVATLVRQISGPLEDAGPLLAGLKTSENGISLSLSQLCENSEQQRVFALMDTTEKVHVEGTLGLRTRG